MILKRGIEWLPQQEESKADPPIRTDATAYVKGKILEVTFESSDARAKKDKIIALLKTAAGRL